MIINPNGYRSSIHKENVTKGVLCFVALCILGGVAALHYKALETFFQNHRTFTTLLLPIGTLGMVLAGSMQYIDRKKQLFVACLATFIVAYILSGILCGFNNTNAWIHQHGRMATLAFFVGFSGFLILNSKKPVTEGEISPLSRFDEVVTDEESREVFYYSRGASVLLEDMPIEKFSNQENNQLVRINVKGFRDVYYQIHEIWRDSKGNITHMSGKPPLFRSIAILSEKKPILDENGQPTGEHHVRMYKTLLPGHTAKYAIPALALGYPLRFGGGIFYNILRIIPLLFLILAKTGNDLAIDKEKRSLDLIGRRIYLMHKVIGDSLRGIVKNAIGLVAALLVTLCSLVESAFRKGQPIHSQILLGEIEQWVNETDLDHSFWSILGCQHEFKLEGNWTLASLFSSSEIDLEKLNEHGTYVMGCCTAEEYGKVNAKGEIVAVMAFGGITENECAIQRPFDVNTSYPGFDYVPNFS